RMTDNLGRRKGRSGNSLTAVGDASRPLAENGALGDSVGQQSLVGLRILRGERSEIRGDDSANYSFGTEYTTTSGPNHYKFTGKEHDTEAHVDYFGARHYGGMFGGFLTPAGSDRRGQHERLLRLDPATTSWENRERPSLFRASTGKTPAASIEAVSIALNIIQDLNINVFKTLDKLCKLVDTIDEKVYPKVSRVESSR